MRQTNAQITQAYRDRQIARERKERKAARFTPSPFVELYRETKAKRAGRDEQQYTEARKTLNRVSA